MKKIVLFILFLFIMTPLWCGPFIKIHSIDTETDFPRVSLLVSARDSDGNWLSGLDEDNLLIYEDGYRVNHVMVAGQSQTADTLYLIFSIDSSKSIPEESFVVLKKAAIDIITASGDTEQIGLCRFNDKVVILKNFSNNKQDLISAVRGIKQHGTKTMLYNAVYDSIELVSRTDSGRKAIVVFTDGKDEGSSVTLRDVVQQSREKGVPLYVISLKSSEHLNDMRRMAKLSGGRTILIESIDSLVLAYKHVIQNIKSQHLIKYVSMVESDGKSHRLEVRLKYKSIRDRDIRDFSVSKEFFTIDFPDYQQILLIVMLLVLISLFGIGVIFLIKRRPSVKKKKKKKAPGRQKENFREEESDFEDEFFDFSQDQADYSDPFEDEPEKKHVEYYSHAWLILQSQGRRKKFPLSKDEVVIGNSHDAHLIVKNNSISPLHCSIKYVDGSYFIFDLVSQDGTYLNGKKLLRPRQLFDWDEITIGSVSFIFRGSNV